LGNHFKGRKTLISKNFPWEPRNAPLLPAGYAVRTDFRDAFCSFKVKVIELLTGPKFQIKGQLQENWVPNLWQELGKAPRITGGHPISTFTRLGPQGTGLWGGGVYSPFGNTRGPKFPGNTLAHAFYQGPLWESVWTESYFGGGGLILKKGWVTNSHKRHLKVSVILQRL